ncbi:MAG: thioredoxin-dependent thiol peroxidase [Prevotella sp.]|nr:thioredoxin-dependent thiol peroxidase [Prevotella sp.]MDD7273807.1 thioredoxin-dependent thiol peroxidase [Prevotellaceae bacterium]MDY3936401.1 thioredoxin-dependent thiol peroxidase [Prevotella sp.]MDY4217992.1 thioredoxin-dependent thiol peroxidase [Prevotella sp.]
MNIGEKAPDVLGKDQDGNLLKVSDYQGKKIVLYFYPKDSTPGCTSQACNLRDNYELMLKRGYVIIGVSVQDEKSHKRFIEKNNLPFPLIADVDKTLNETFGVYGEKKMCGRTYMGTYRTTFIIDENGNIEEIFTPKQIKVKEHAEQIFAAADAKIKG